MINIKYTVWLICVTILMTNSAWSDHASQALGVGAAAPISTESAITLPQGKWAVGIRSEYQELDSFSDRELGALHESDEEGDFHSVDSLWNNSVAAAYGITDDFTVGIRLPFLLRNDIKEPEHDGGGEIEELGDVEGVGDLSVTGLYRLYHEEGTHITGIFGFKAPTGKTHRHNDHGERFEAEFQPGSGSWDGTVGAAFTQEMGSFAFYSSVVYTFVTEGSQHTDLGDIFTYNSALSYRLIGPEGDSSLVPNFTVDLVAEVNGEWRDKEKTRGDHDDNSGGNLLYLSPGIRVGVAENANLGFSFGIPVVKDTNGSQVEPDYRLITTGSIVW